MLHYYFTLALKSLRSQPVLSLLMVLALGLGIGACMTTLTVWHVLSADPMSGRGEQLHIVQLDPQDMIGYQPGKEPEEQLTRFDAEALLQEKRADRQAMMTGGYVFAQDSSARTEAEGLRARYTSADFFPMFEVPFAQGGAWTEGDDRDKARIAVISAKLARKLFGSGSAIGHVLLIQGREFRVTGVLGDWRPVPHFYDLYGGSFADLEDVFLPFSTALDLSFSHSGNTNCWGNPGDAPQALNAPCVWIQYWVKLETPEKATAYLDYLKAYSARQHEAGRFQRPTNVRLRNVREWLDYQQVVPDDVKLQVWLALGFLLVCLSNTVGLLLSKCLRAAPQIGVRRALGATRRAIFAQYLVEAMTLGLAGGLLGILLAWLGLQGVRQNPSDYASLARLDGSMLALTVLVALLASLLAGLLPAWRATQIAPAVHLKTQ